MGYSWQDDILRYKDRVVISPTSTLKSRILAELHSSSIAGHSGFQKTYACTRRSLFWIGMKKDILTFVAECDVCQRHKEGNRQHTKHITTIAHFGINLDGGFYGFHYRSSKVRKQELFRIQGTQLKLSTSYHLQTDGQTEAVNKCLQTYLRCFTSEKQHLWVQWLPLAEWWYNTNYHATTKMTPYEAVYGQFLPSPTSYLKGCSKVQAVDQLLQHRATMLAHLRENLHQAQNRMKQQVDLHRSERQFQEGDQVFLRLQPYKQTSLKDNGCQKLSPKFYGPYQVLQHIGEVAYKLALPPTANIHPIFHVSCLKKVIGNNCRIHTSLPELDEEGSIWLQPEQVLDTRVKQLHSRMIKEVLVK
eukprot:PITA_30421